MSQVGAVMLFGIPNCDTVKRARAWLAGQGAVVEFHDFKRRGVPSELLDAWCTALGWERLLNRKGTTWRGLDDAQRAAVVDAASAKALMQSQPSVIKRPVVAWPDGRITVGVEVNERLQAAAMVRHRQPKGQKT